MKIITVLARPYPLLHCECITGFHIGIYTCEYHLQYILSFISSINIKQYHNNFPTLKMHITAYFQERENGDDYGCLPFN